MAQPELFDALAGVDNSAYLAVQSILDTQPVPEENSSHQNAIPPQDDDDVFVCGKCRSQFSSLNVFIAHKQLSCGGANSATQILQPAQLQQIPAVPQLRRLLAGSATQNQLSTNVVLPDDLTLALDPNEAAALQQVQQQNRGIQNSPFLSSAQVITNPQPTVVSVPLSSIGSVIGKPVQFHPITVVSTHITALPTVTSAHHRQDLFSNGGEGSGTITVLVDNAGHSLETEGSQPYLATDDQGALRGKDPMMAPQKPRPVTKSRTKKASKFPKPKRHCPWCKKRFTKNFDLQQHLRAHTGEKPFQCVVCGRAFSQKSNVKKHMLSHKVWPLGVAGHVLPKQPAPQLVVVQEKSMVKASRKAATGEATESTGEPAGLPYSGAAEPDKTGAEDVDDSITSMKWHFLVDSSYVCPYCPNAQTRFDSYYQLKTHLASHLSEQVYRCVMSTCGETFPELDDFLEHTKEHESRNELTYRCHVCNKAFPSLDELGTHQYVHSFHNRPDTTLDNRRKRSGWKFKCIGCGNAYTTPEALEHHTATTPHSHVCPHCAKVYVSVRLLRKHLLTHEDRVEFTCDVCQAVLKSEYYLTIHMRIHTGEKPFACHICNMRFNRKDKVTRHLTTHDPIKRYVCPFKDISGCDKAFPRADKLKEHIAKHKKVTLSKVVEGTSSDETCFRLLTKPLKGEKVCQHCESSRFDNDEELSTHELLCSQVPRMKCSKCHLTFNTVETYTSHECNPDSAISLAISRFNSGISVRTRRKRLLKKKKLPPPRIELSPPPTKRNKRGIRSRAAVRRGDSTSKVETFRLEKHESATEDPFSSHGCLGDEYSHDAQSEFLSQVLLVRNNQSNNANFCSSSSVEEDQHSQHQDDRDGTVDADNIQFVGGNERDENTLDLGDVTDNLVETMRHEEDTPNYSDGEKSASSYRGSSVEPSGGEQD